jgi:plasmid replication initiation protein
MTEKNDKKAGESSTVVKHNAIINAEYELTLFEQRVLLSCISKINSMNKLSSNDLFEVSVEDIADLISTTDKGSIYTHLNSTVKRLAERWLVIDYPLDDNEVKQKRTRWISGIDYMKREGVIRLTFAPGIIPYLSELSKNFTQYKLDSVVLFKSIYSFRLYEMLVMWGVKGEKTVQIEWLREKMQLLDKYKNASDFKKWVIDVAVDEINRLSNSVVVSYESIKRGKSIAAFKFTYTIKKSPARPNIQQDEIFHSTSTLSTDLIFDFSQFNDKDKQLAKNALAKVPEATQRIILDMFKSALAKGGVKSPLHYLNSLVSKSLSGDLDTTAFDNVPTPSNHFEKQTRRADKIKQTFAKHTDEIKAKLADDGHIFIQGEGTVSKSEFEALGLIEKVSRKGYKSISLSDLMAKAEEQEHLRKEKEIAQKKAKREKQPKTVADIPVVPLTEKQMAARQKILELEAQLIAAGEFVGVNKNVMSDDEIVKLAEIDATLKKFKP